MRHRGLAHTVSKAAVLAAAISMFASPIIAEAQPVPADLTTMPPVPTSYVPKKTSWGDPDLRGTYPLDSIASIPMQRPAQYGNRFWLTDEEFAARAERANASTKAYEAEDKSGKIGMGHWVESDASGRRTAFLIDPPNGQLPAFTPQAQALMKAGRSSWTPNTKYDWVTDFDSWDRCVSRGFPASMFPFRYNNGIRLYQAPGTVSIALEMLGTRVIPIAKGNDRTHWPAAVESWLGNSIGHWEGNTLVIETTNIKSGDSATRDSYARNGSPLNMATLGVPPANVIPTSKKAKVVERITPVSANQLVYEMTYSDPEVFTAPWTARLDWNRNDKYEFYEYACHEGDVQVRNYITASRAGRLDEATAEQRAQEAAGGGSQ
jgi:hypothetical protein